MKSSIQCLIGGSGGLPEVLVSTPFATGTLIGSNCFFSGMSIAVASRGDNSSKLTFSIYKKKQCPFYTNCHFSLLI